MYKTIIFMQLSMGVKLGVSDVKGGTDCGCLRAGCWESIWTEQGRSVKRLEKTA
jgi:hypothetical protein